MTTTIQARIDAESKEQAKKILNFLGLSMSEAISLYFRQIILRRGIPFDIEIPNELTARVLADADKKKRLRKAANVNKLFKALNR
jgi:DNA-damage-inducible protein J